MELYNSHDLHLSESPVLVFGMPACNPALLINSLDRYIMYYVILIIKRAGQRIGFSKGKQV